MTFDHENEYRRRRGPPCQARNEDGDGDVAEAIQSLALRPAKGIQVSAVRPGTSRPSPARAAMANDLSTQKPIKDETLAHRATSAVSATYSKSSTTETCAQLPYGYR
ncbi:hypothetical protein NXS19_008463 [Fusarium pseudograminearum]|nr:hypothetical protein NXS19_008463 [Fusarium pseudograminearum]